MSPDSSSADLLSLHRFSSALLQNMVASDRKGNVLVVANGVLPPPDCPCLDRDERSFGIAVCIRQGQLQIPVSAGIPLDCSSTDLPFQDEAFHTVILYLVIGDGSEQELEEACRVLAPGGSLLVVGLNRRGWSSRKVCRQGPLPALRVARVRGRLQARGLIVDRMVGVGLMGRGKPRMERHRLSGLALPFADVVALSARHRHSPAVSRPGLKKFPAGAVPTAMTSL